MLGPRWRVADWSASVYEATIPNFADKRKSISLQIEATRSGQFDAALTIGDQPCPVGKDDGSLYPSLESAEQDILKAIRWHFQNHRKGEYVLGFTPWRTDRQIKEGLGVTQSTANDWRRRQMLMSRRTVTVACLAMGIRAYGRGRGPGGGEILKLETADWDRETA
jgi:hypothetical protein